MAESRCSVVETFLENIDLELLRYSQRFESQGYKTAFDLCLLEEEDLDSISITDPEDREKILNAAGQMDIELCLDYLQLESYVDHFKTVGIKTVRDLKNRAITDDLLDCLEVMVPGDRKRVKWAASFLKQYSETAGLVSGSLASVVIGYWGQPPDMTDNIHPFLCVPGYLKSESGENARSSELIRFTVDSGSEIGVTVTDSLISQLRLEYLRNIDSRGVHAAANKPVYRGVLKLGEEEMEVEVMPDTFATVGGVVMRKFKHYINGTLHRWLKDDPVVPS